MIDRYQVLNPDPWVCPDCEYKDVSIQLVWEHMTAQHEEIVLSVLEDRERRYQARMKTYWQTNPPKRPEG